jgi:hypothetical protein
MSHSKDALTATMRFQAPAVAGSASTPRGQSAVRGLRRQRPHVGVRQLRCVHLYGAAPLHIRLGYNDGQRQTTWNSWDARMRGAPE